jgi:GT2 family glycosyltransferase
MVTPLCSIVIVTYNSEKWIEKCLVSIRRAIEEIDDPIEVVVVDNSSTDRTREIIGVRFSWVKVIPLYENLGFGRANNLAVKEIMSKYLFFLNPDTFLEKMALYYLLKYAKNKERVTSNFILIPKLFTYDKKKFLGAGLAVDIFGYPLPAYNNSDFKKIRPIFYAEGAALFIPQKTFHLIGGFDEEMFMYQEDIDLAWKAHLLGIKLYVVDEAVVFHEVGASAGGGIKKGSRYTTTLFRRRLVERNIIRNLIKNYSWHTLIWVLPLNFFINFLEFFIFIIVGRPRAALIYPQAYWWNLVHLTSTLSKRRWIQGKRKIADGEIMKKMSKIPSKVYILKELGIPRVE